MLLLCGCAFAALFSLVALAFAINTGDWSVFRVCDDPAEQRLLVWPFRDGLRTGRLTHAQLLASVGLLNALNEVLVVYSSPPERTPPLISSVLQNANVLFSVPFAKWVLLDRKVYADVLPLAAASLIVSSVIVSTLPTLLEGSGSSSSSGSGGIAWALVYLMGLVPQALMNTLQQLFFFRTGIDDSVSRHEETRAFLRAILFSMLAQACAFPCLFWLDLIPRFGFSHSFKQLWRETGNSLVCSLAGAGVNCKPARPLFAWAFIGANLSGYYSSAVVNKESATFNMLLFVLITSCTSVIFYVCQPPGVQGTSTLWSVLLSLLLSFAGSGVWKYWEGKTPLELQFGVTDHIAQRADVFYESLQERLEADEEGAPAGGEEEEEFLNAEEAPGGRTRTRRQGLTEYIALDDR